MTLFSVTLISEELEGIFASLCLGGQKPSVKSNKKSTTTESLVEFTMRNFEEHNERMIVPDRGFEDTITGATSEAHQAGDAGIVPLPRSISSAVRRAIE